jgi:glycosyltransferase involved in cell wall biosynthesis
MSRPALVTVVMPILNEEDHVGEQLAALVAQTYQGNWELVVADNGCTDGTLEIVESWRERLPALRLADASVGRGLNHARNVGASAARGELLAFCDADDVVDPRWLGALVGSAREADIVGGAEEFEVLNGPRVRAWYGSWSHQGLLTGYDFLPYVAGGNMAVWTRVARQVRWNEAFVFGASDAEFCWRAQIGGLRVAAAPDAIIHRRLRTELPAVARQAYGYGRGGPRLYCRFRGRGMPWELRTAVKKWLWLAHSAPFVLRTADGRGAWLYAAALRAGRLAGSIRERALYL